MRHLLHVTSPAVLGAVLLLGPALAEAQDALPAQDQEEIHQYTGAIPRVIDYIIMNYVVPPERGPLVHAALKGLYEQAELEVPGNLKKDVDAAIGKEGADREEERDSTAVAGLIGKVRIDLGAREKLRGRQALRASINAMTRSLDPWSGLVEADDMMFRGRRLQPGLGLALAVDARAEKLLVKAVAIGGPAQRAGLKPGDQVLRFDGKTIGPGKDETSPEEGLALARKTESAGRNPFAPEIGNKIEVEVKSPGNSAPRTLTLVSQVYTIETVLGCQRKPDESWDYVVDHRNKIGYVRLGPLEPGTADALDEIVKELRAEGMRGLILDVRWNPGGSLNESVLCARMFLKEGEFARAVYRDARNNEEYHADKEVFGVAPTDKHLDFPLIVMINGQTTGGGELIAAALQDHKRAMVFGQRSRGKGSIQTPHQLPDFPEAPFRLTTGHFLRANGKRHLQQFPDKPASEPWGVVPDAGLDMPVTPEMSQRFADWWLQHCLRPYRSNEALPLDDPTMDSQRQGALIHMRRLLGAGQF